MRDISKKIEIRGPGWSSGKFALQNWAKQEVRCLNLGSDKIKISIIFSFHTFCYATPTYVLIDQHTKNKEYLWSVLLCTKICIEIYTTVSSLGDGFSTSETSENKTGIIWFQECCRNLSLNPRFCIFGSKKGFYGNYVVQNSNHQKSIEKKRYSLNIFAFYIVIKL